MLRTPLAPRSSNVRRGPELSSFQRGIILGKRLEGCTAPKIAKDLGTPESTIKYTLYHTAQNPNGVTKARTGRPKKLTDREQRRLIRIVRLEPRKAYLEVKKELGVEIHKNTLYNYLSDYGLTNWLAKKRPLLTPEVAAQRLAWCKEREFWGYEEWLKVIWSDECSVERGTGKKREWVFRFPHEKWNKEMIQPYKKGRGVSVMVWGAFYGKERANLVVMSRDQSSIRQGYSANSYIEVLDEAIPTL